MVGPICAALQVTCRRSNVEKTSRSNKSVCNVLMVLAAFLVVLHKFDNILKQEWLRKLEARHEQPRNDRLGNRHLETRCNDQRQPVLGRRRPSHALPKGGEEPLRVQRLVGLIQRVQVQRRAEPAREQPVEPPERTSAKHARHGFRAALQRLPGAHEVARLAEGLGEQYGDLGRELHREERGQEGVLLLVGVVAVVKQQPEGAALCGVKENGQREIDAEDGGGPDGALVLEVAERAHDERRRHAQRGRGDAELGAMTGGPRNENGELEGGKDNVDGLAEQWFSREAIQ